MRRSSSFVRGSSTWNICIFCANGSDGIIPSIRRSTVAQQRDLHYSNNAPQSASATQLRHDDHQQPPSSSNDWGQSFGAAATPISGLNAEERRIKENLQKRRQQQALQQAALAARSAPAPQQQERGGFGLSSPLGGLTREEQRIREEIQRRQAQNASRTPQNTRSSQGQDRRGFGLISPARREPVQQPSRPPGERFTLRRLDSTHSQGPPTPEVLPMNPERVSNWSHLRKRGEVSQPAGSRDGPRASNLGRSEPAAASSGLGDFLKSMEKNPRPSEPRRKRDDGELERLMGGFSQGNKQPDQRQARPYVPLARESVGGFKCFRCGEAGHRGSDCPTVQQFVPTSRLKYGSQNAPLREGRNDALSATNEPNQAASAEASSIVSATDHYDAEKRAAAEAWRRRSARFTQKEEEPAYEKDRRKGRMRIARSSAQEDEMDEGMARAERKRRRKDEKRKAQLTRTEPTPIQLPEYISVTNLASALKIRVEDFVRKLEELGFEDIQNDHILNAENSALVAMEYNFEPIIQAAEEDIDLHPAPLPEDVSILPARPPVVTIMGHVDHGKTTILDFLRNSSVAASEFGGITQHIGAFSVPLESGKTITFLDTPGHAAFLSMRQRGANVTDIVILVVAADDSVKPQTIEAIKHAQSANVPIIVAINKIDKEEANPDRVKQDLARHGVDVEDFGGETQVVCVSGKTGTGMPALEESIVTLSEILDHRADPEGPVEGWVLEGTTRKSGRVATLLIRRGTLHVGDILVAGTTWARVRTLKNEAGAHIDAVGPGMPVEVDGWREQPLAGDEVLQAPDEQKASAVSEFRADAEERIRLAKDMEAINEFRRVEAERIEKEKAVAAAEAAGEDDPAAVVAAVAKMSGPEIVPFIVKADVSGSVEAVTDSIAPLGNAEVGCSILRSGVGPPSEFDVQHAAAAKGHIINFNTTIPPQIAALAEEKGVRVLDSNIIYRLSEDVRALLSERLPPTVVKRVTGEAEVAQMFSITLAGRKKIAIAGSKVRNGVMKKGALVRVVRGEENVYEGTLSSLKNVKKDVLEMPKNSECGIGFEDWEGFEVGDKVQCYEETREKRYL